MRRCLSLRSAAPVDAVALMTLRWGYSIKGDLVRSVNTSLSCGFGPDARPGQSQYVAGWYADETKAGEVVTRVQASVSERSERGVAV